ncbi:TPA: hypothetical protein ACX6RS_003338 [Photobacterium damselae]
MRVYRRRKQTKYVMAGKSGLLTIHDNGKIAASGEHKKLMFGFVDSKLEGSYLVLKNPSTREKGIIMNRLFSLPDDDL